MSTPREQVLSRGAYVAVPRHKVLTNTYALLSLTLLFSAATAGVSMALALPHPGIIITLVGYFGLLWLTHKFSNSAVGILWVFALTGFMGYTLGPILNAYITHFANGTQLVMMAMGGTGAVFLGLSAYALTSRKDFSFLGGMLGAGILVAFLAGLVAVFVPGLMGLSLAVSAMFVVLMAGLILFQTSAIIHGGETNYILATVTLYVTIFNLFTSLLQLLGVFGSDD
ncbi:MAG: Bax inhibitor-1/YccA family protein [Pseudomonadota bacterium]